MPVRILDVCCSLLLTILYYVLSGDAVFDLHGHEGVVRHLVFPQNGTLTLISSSRDKTLRIWDLAHKGLWLLEEYLDN